MRGRGVGNSESLRACLPYSRSPDDRDRACGWLSGRVTGVWLKGFWFAGTIASPLCTCASPVSGTKFVPCANEPTREGGRKSGMAPERGRKVVLPGRCVPELCVPSVSCWGCGPGPNGSIPAPAIRASSPGCGGGCGRCWGYPEVLKLLLAQLRGGELA